MSAARAREHPTLVNDPHHAASDPHHASAGKSASTVDPAARSADRFTKIPHSAHRSRDCSGCSAIRTSSPPHLSVSPSELSLETRDSIARWASIRNEQGTGQLHHATRTGHHRIVHRSTRADTTAYLTEHDLRATVHHQGGRHAHQQTRPVDREASPVHRVPPCWFVAQPIVHAAHRTVPRRPSTRLTRPPTIIALVVVSTVEHMTGTAACRPSTTATRRAPLGPTRHSHHDASHSHHLA